MQKYGAVYLAIVGGAAALETQQIEEVEAVYWEHLHPEALYQFRVKDFGPLTVAMDSHGRHLYEEVKAEAMARLPAIYKALGV
jgi:L(+)-tartrate dehydratase beta subunit